MTLKYELLKRLVKAANIKKRWAGMKKYGADFELIVGEGMFHCYPVFPICREAKEGWELMIRRMKENTK